MKKILSMVLLLALLMQATPLAALASTGEILSSDALAQAYALTGFARGDGAYHNGMKPNASWSAMELVDWLDEVQRTELDNVTDILSRASNTLVALEKTDPEKYERMKRSGPQGQGVIDRLRALTLQAEALREELSYQQDRLRQDAGVIAELGERIEQERDELFDSTLVRLSAKVEEAVADLKDARREVVSQHSEWEAQIRQWNMLLSKVVGAGGGGTGEPDDFVNSWLSELFVEKDAIETNTAPVSVVSANGTRLSRLSAMAGASANEDPKATVTVMSENQIAIRLLDGKSGEPVEGIEVTVSDLQSEVDPRVELTDENGVALIESSAFKADSSKNMRLKLSVDAEENGFRSFEIKELSIKLGQEWKACLVPLDDKPYLYSASFNGHDILFQDWQMIFSPLNDMDFVIEAETRMPGGGETPALDLFYHDVNDYVEKIYSLDPGTEQEQLMEWVSLTQTKAPAPTRKGNTFTWKGKWKQRLMPRTRDGMVPSFRFDGVKNSTTLSRLISVRAVVDKPMSEGTKAFSKVLEKGMSLSFKIPALDLKVEVNAPFQQYLPKIDINPDAFVTISWGSAIMEDATKEFKGNWKSRDFKELKEAEELFQKEGWYANAKSKMAVAYDYYKRKGWKFIGSSKLDVGLFIVGSGRWNTDSSDAKNVEKDINLRVAIGVTVSYSISLTWSIPILYIPVYISVDIGLSAGMALGRELRFLYINGKLQNWRFLPLKDVTINLGFTFAITTGVGIKGVASIWAKGTASLNVLLMFVVMGNDTVPPTVTYDIGVDVGVELLFAKASKRVWTFAKGQLYPPLKNNGGAGSLLENYLAENAAEEVVPASQVPDSYPELVPEAKKILSADRKARNGIRVVQLNGHAYVFYLQQVGGGNGKTPFWRVGWIDQNTGASGSLNDEMKLLVQQSEYGQSAKLSLERSDFDFDVYAADGHVFVVGVCAKKFDENGLPVPNFTKQGGDENIMAYAMVLKQKSDGKLSSLFEPRTGNRRALRYAFMCEAPLAKTGQYDTLSAPVITHASVTWLGDAASGNVRDFYLCGGFGRIAYPQKQGDATVAVPSPGGTSFSFNGRAFRFYSDRYVAEPMGNGYDRVDYVPALRPTLLTSRYQESSGNPSASWIALSAPKDNGDGQRAIEMFDYDMNDRGDGNTSIKAAPLVLEKGDIRHIEVLSWPSDKVATNYYRRVFYSRREVKNGLSQYRLSGMYIEPVQSDHYDAASKQLSYPVTKYDYDITLPTEQFYLTQVGDVPCLYWLSTASKKKDSDPDLWRVNIVTFDPVNNVMSDPSVFAEFTLPKGEENLTPQAVTLTTLGSGYITLAAKPNEKDTQPSIISLYSFPMKYKPVLTLKGLTIKESTVSKGDFLDATVSLMNEGNMGASAFDLELYTKDGNKVDVVETLHVDCLKPNNSTLTLQDGSSKVSLPSSRRVAYRDVDYDYAMRKHDWVLKQEKSYYRFNVGKKDGYGPAGVHTERSASNHIRTSMLMPGALASFNITLRIPEDWNGSKTIFLRLKQVNSARNWMGAMANAALREAGLAVNDAGEDDSQELAWKLDDSGEQLVLDRGGLQANDARLALYDNDIPVQAGLPLDSSVHNISITHRLYDGYGDDDDELVDIVISNDSHTEVRFRLSCAVYLDGGETPYYVNLPYKDTQVSADMTQTITLPLSALVPDLKTHSQARVVITAVGQEECALVNNEFMLYFGNGEALQILEQPADATVQVGEDVSFRVEATGGKPPYAYQWQVWDGKHQKWVDLPGFTQPILSRDRVEKKWDGAKFRCVITDADGHKVVSREVTLTVRDKVPTGDNSRLPLYLLVAALALAALWWIYRRERALR